MVALTAPDVYTAETSDLGTPRHHRSLVPYTPHMHVLSLYQHPQHSTVDSFCHCHMTTYNKYHNDINPLRTRGQVLNEGLLTSNSFH